MKTKYQLTIGMIIGVIIGIFCYAYGDYMASKGDTKRVVVEAPVVKSEPPPDEFHKFSVMEKRDAHYNLIEIQRSWVERREE